MKSQRSKQSGFTLVEIAIVLVIIGLLLGGVLKGQEMITSSKAKGVASDRNGLLAAYNMYTDRYKAMPGDDAQAGVLVTAYNGIAIGTAGRFTVAQCGGAQCINGNGDGVLIGAWNSVLVPTNGNNEESRKFFQHLRAAGFLKVEGGNLFIAPTNAANGLVGVQAANLYVGARGGSVQYVSGNLPTNIAQALDTSNDDGFQNLGGWRAANNVAANTNAGVQFGANAAGVVTPTVHNVQNLLF
jgi:prepilin-type N-terminal cleavage/methylation domain-containing protein